VQLATTVVTATGVVRPVGQVTGPFPKLLELEKQVVFGLAAQLGIVLSQSEREQILRQGPKNLAAFLAYSRALDAMDRGDYDAATRDFRTAAQADPGFQAARQGQQAAGAAPIAQQATGGDIVMVVDAVERLPGALESTGVGSAGGVLGAGTRDVVPTVGDAVAARWLVPTGASTIDRQVTAEAAGLPSILSVTNGITIIFKRP